MLQIYVDSSYDWRNTVDGFGKGEICIAIPELNILKKEEATIGVKGLKQLNNRFELLAIQLGVDYAEKKLKKRAGEFVVYSDSQTAIAWAKHPNVQWIKRDDNIAGHEFEK